MIGDPLDDAPCVYCGNDAELRDHVIARQYGGTDDPSNLVPSCRPCNDRKGTMPAELVGMSKQERVTWLRDRGWRIVKGAWLDPQTGKPHIWGWAVRIEAWNLR